MQIIKVLPHGQNIQYSDFNSVNNMLYSHKPYNGDAKINYPSFVKPYVIGLVKKFEREHRNIKVTSVSACDRVTEYLYYAKAYPLLLGLLGNSKKKTVFSHQEYDKNIYDEFATYLSRNRINSLDEIILNIGELGENAIEHGFDNQDEAKFSIIAQYYPNIKRLEVCIIDSGKGISRNVFNFLSPHIKSQSFEEVEKKIFEFAFHGQFTTRPGGRGGNGLYSLRQKLKSNMRLVIACNNYYYDIALKTINSAKLDNPFEGTFIHLSFEL